MPRKIELMNHNVRFMDGILKVICKNIRRDSAQLSQIYDECLRSGLCYSKKHFKIQAITINELLSIFNSRFEVIFKNSRKDCVPYSLALHILLYCFGFDSVLYIGIDRFPFSAHAWVEDLEGNVLSCSDHLCKNRRIVFEKRLIKNG